MKALHLNKLSWPGASDAPHQSGASVWKSFNSYKTPLTPTNTHQDRQSRHTFCKRLAIVMECVQRYKNWILGRLRRLCSLKIAIWLLGAFRPKYKLPAVQILEFREMNSPNIFEHLPIGAFERKLRRALRVSVSCSMVEELKQFREKLDATEVQRPLQCMSPIILHFYRTKTRSCRSWTSCVK